MSLSFSMEGNNGVYDLLLDFGWRILKELCRRIMLINGEKEKNMIIKWLEEKIDGSPLYDEVLSMLAKTSSEWNGLPCRRGRRGR